MGNKGNLVVAVSEFLRARARLGVVVLALGAATTAVAQSDSGQSDTVQGDPVQGPPPSAPGNRPLHLPENPQL